MIAVSNDFKVAMKEPIKELDGYIQLDENTKITSADDLISFKISCDTGMCKTAMKKLEAKYLGEHNLLGKWVHVGFGVKLPNSTFEYLDYGSFLVSEITTAKDTGITNIVAYDKMINSMKPYEVLDIEYPINLYNYTQNLCSIIGLELGNETFANSNWTINYELWENINGITYRDILTQIAQATASTCIISNDDKIYFKTLTETNESLTYDNMKKLKLEPIYGEINSVVLARTPQEDNYYKKDFESIEQNGLTEYRIENNEIIDKDRVNAMLPIYNVLHGINYYPFETTTEGLGWYEIADKFEIINDKGTVFNTALFKYSIQIDGGIKEILKTVAETKTQTQYQYATAIDKRVKNAEIIVDNQNQTISSVVSNVGEQNIKISQVEQTVNSLNSKISDIADITTMQEKQVCSMNFENINQSEPIHIEIKPTIESISYLYPSSNLYPADDLYVKSRTLKFTNITTEEVFTYELPDDLLFYNSDVYDSFVLDYESQTCYVNKKCKYNNGVVEVTGYEQTISYDYPRIELTDGDYKVEIIKYNGIPYTAYFMVRLMAQNIYTTQFATRAEVNSNIRQTADNINLEVSKKIDADEIINAINVSTEGIKINGDKIDIDGEAVHFKTNITLRKGPYTEEDYEKVQQYLMQEIELDYDEIQRLDANNDGRIDSGDLLAIRKAISFFDGYYLYDATFEINPYSNKDTIKLTRRIVNGSGENEVVCFNFSLLECYLENIYSDYISTNELNVEGSAVIQENLIVLESIECSLLTQTSLKEKKKNFEKLTNALEIIKNIDIYKYNLKSENDEAKKHIGFVIGDDYNYSKELTSNDNTGVDLYSLASCCLQAIKEQQTQINELKQEIEILKRGNK